MLDSISVKRAIRIIEKYSKIWRGVCKIYQNGETCFNREQKNNEDDEIRRSWEVEVVL